jgi:hypothetical protein
MSHILFNDGLIKWEDGQGKLFTENYILLGFQE